MNIKIKDHFENQIEFHSLETLSQFLSTGLDKHTEIRSRNRTLISSRNSIHALKNTLDSLDMSLENIESEIQRLATSHQRDIIDYRSLEFKLIKDLSMSGHDESIETFVLVLKGKNAQTSNINQLIGANKALDLLSTKEKIPDTLDLSISSISDTIREAYKKLEEIEFQKKIELDKLEEIINETENITSELLSDSTDRVLESVDEIEKKHESCLKNITGQLTNILNSSKSKMANLEKTYEAKLKLSSPARYWNKSAKKHKHQGYLSLAFLLAAISIGIYGFFELLYAYLAGVNLGISLRTLHGVALSTSLIATYAFLIRFLSRLTLSSFHLMRDSEEREQLSYFYLALRHEANLDESISETIIQALFSRADTGLISGDSSPTMPNVSDIARSSGAMKG